MRPPHGLGGLSPADAIADAAPATHGVDAVDAGRPPSVGPPAPPLPLACDRAVRTHLGRDHI